MKSALLTLLLALSALQVATAQVIHSHRVGFHYRLKPQRLEKLAEQGIFLTSLDPPKNQLNGNYDASFEAVAHPIKGLVKITSTSLKTPRDTFTLCRQTNVLRVLIKSTDDALFLDPLINKNRDKLCADTVVRNQRLGRRKIARLRYINEDTKPGLQMKFLARERLGNSISKINLSYQTLLISINTIAFKTRPRVTDYNGTELKAAIVGGSFNLGLSAGYSFGWSTFTPRS